MIQLRILRWKITLNFLAGPSLSQGCLEEESRRSERREDAIQLTLKLEEEDSSQEL